MEGIVAVLTDKEQSLVRAIGITGMSTHGACLACVVSIDFDSHTSRKGSFVSNVPMQFSKTPFGVGVVGTSLLLTSFLASFASRSLSDICQVFQPNDGMRVLVNDAFGNDMISVLFQP